MIVAHAAKLNSFIICLTNEDIAKLLTSEGILHGDGNVKVCISHFPEISSAKAALKTFCSEHGIGIDEPIDPSQTN